MRKGPEPAALARSRQEVRRQGRESGPVADPWAETIDKQEIAEALCRDQNGLCAYCGGRIRPGAMKIEHFVPRAAAPERAHDWKNLLGVCLGESGPVAGGTTRFRHCDASRTPYKAGPPPQGLLHIHPVESGPDPAALLPVSVRGLTQGQVMPQSPDAAADLDELNLNAAILIHNRRQAIEALREQVRTLSSPTEISQRLRHLRAVATSEEAELPPYAHVATAWIDKHLRALRPSKP